MNTDAESLYNQFNLHASIVGSFQKFNSEQGRNFNETLDEYYIRMAGYYRKERIGSDLIEKVYLKYKYDFQLFNYTIDHFLEY